MFNIIFFDASLQMATCNKEKVQLLDSMLHSYKIPHAFTVVNSFDLFNGPTSTVFLNFERCNEISVNLIYALFCKQYLNIDVKQIAKNVIKVASQYI